ncbi:hypothetical protein C4577_01565 [Candidatus Parcubacteria bacterium]|nr:MAG: hypothetical protein C4577_01565 [Candidatus Parcubacteria bacterium]
MRKWFLNSFFKARIFLLVLSVIFLVVSSLAYENKVFFIHFVDEEDNIVLGKYLLKGEKLYSDLFSQHQPLAYIFSAGVQKTTQPNSLYLLIKRHREFIILYSVVWSLILVALFRWPLFLFIVIYEPLKFYLFGNLFLSETLVVYPLLYLLIRIFFSKKSFLNYELILTGFCFGLVIFLLSPIWPLTIFVFLYLLYRIKAQISKNIFLVSLGLLVPTLISLTFSSINEYFYNVFYVNYKYYIPIGSQDSFIIGFLKSLSAPVISLVLTSETGPVIWITKLLSVILIFNLLILASMKKYWHTILFFVILGLANSRYITPGKVFYEGFHLLPWVSALLMVVIFSTVEVIKDTDKKFLRIVPATLIAVTIFFSFYFSLYDSIGLLQKRDMANDQYINYSRQFDFGEAIRIMKNEKDRLFVIPDEWLLYWQADIKHASYMVNYYAWMPSVPKIKTDVDNMFVNNPPEFFYCEPCDEKDLIKYGNYQIVKKEKKNTKLYILKDKAKQLSIGQVRQLDFYHFSLE